MRIVWSPTHISWVCQLTDECQGPLLRVPDGARARELWPNRIALERALRDAGLVVMQNGEVIAR